MDIKMLIMDVDGTLTDGKLYYTSDGLEMKAFDIKDGYAVKYYLPQYRIIPVVITGRTSSIVLRRAEELGIKEVYQGVSNKLEVLRSLMQRYDLKKGDVAYIGDDLIDIICMTECGYAGCPADAAQEVLAVADYISRKNGGNGAVRDFIEHIVRFKRQMGETDEGAGTLD